MDAETYLRCRLEDSLVGGESQEQLRIRVRAALAVRAIEATVAERVLDDAHRVRTRGRSYDDDHDRSSGAPRVVVCPTTIESSWGTALISHVVLRPDRTAIGVSGSIRTDARTRRWRRSHEPFADLQAQDSSGTILDVNFSGGSSDSDFHGEFHLHPALAIEATEFTIAGRTIDLRAATPPAAITINTLDELNVPQRAQRHLRLVRDAASAHSEYDEGAIAHETFVALGLEVDDNESEATPSRLRQPRRRREAYPAVRLVPIAATVDGLDGLTLTMTVLSEDGHFGMFGSRTGPVADPHGWPLFSISAVDDLGQAYAASSTQSSHGGGSFSSTQKLTPDLRRDARTLTFSIDTLSCRAELELALDWQDPR